MVSRDNHARRNVPTPPIRRLMLLPSCKPCLSPWRAQSVHEDCVTQIIYWCSEQMQRSRDSTKKGAVIEQPAAQDRVEMKVATTPPQSPHETFHSRWQAKQASSNEAVSLSSQSLGLCWSTQQLQKAMIKVCHNFGILKKQSNILY